MARKRIALTIPEEADEVLTDLSNTLGKSKTTIIADIIFESLPTLKLVADAMKHAKSGMDEVAMVAVGAALKDAGFKVDQIQSDFFAMQRERKGNKQQ